MSPQAQEADFWWWWNYTFNKYNKEAKHKNKSLCVNDVDSSEKTENDSSGEDEVNNFMLMAIDDIGNEYT